MISNIHELGKKVLELSTYKRVLLIRKILESLEDGEEAEKVEELWINESKRRQTQHKQGKTSEKPAKQVLKDTKKNLKLLQLPFY